MGSRLGHKKVVVLGASGRIGSAVSSRLAQEGCWLVLAGRKADRLARVAEKARRSNTKLRTAFFNCLSEQSMDNLFAIANNNLGGIDCIVNCVGIASKESLLEVDTSVWKNQMNTNLTGFLLCLKYGIPYLLNHGGDIINVSSFAALHPLANRAAYSASKSAAHALADAALQEFYLRGVRISSIAPGVVSRQEIGSLEINDKQLVDTSTIAEAVIFLLILPRNAVIREIIIERMAAVRRPLP